MTHYAIQIVTGAPGAGKSTALAAFLQLNSAYIAFDIDWLLEPASRLAGKDIRVEPATWQPYNALWLEMMRAIRENSRVPVLFAPLDERDLPAHARPAWCAAIHWLLLDCTDAQRRQRLTQRPGWTPAMIEEAIIDARGLRNTVADRIDTGTLPPHQVATTILAWLQCISPT